MSHRRRHMKTRIDVIDGQDGFTPDSVKYAHPKTRQRIVVVDGVDGLTPDMLRHRGLKVVYDRNVPQGMVYAINSRMIATTGPRPWWADPMHD